ncbi:prepilin-type N-terminal cleavage/methylation domain-containing protein [Alteromonas sp. BL110]|uniref:GspH/FimT family pseudopilin n=1 Tax=Alteromonas sp. BL110 TaxID=1714845 RepID=UPI000E531E0B|nr:GspH/FimT family pseudopilin [Alteromonas sp. BL110]AXT39750.1 prepilin-type N-terminal cleavage/methylation domain-containing protein [Alteromonas sp. BL110]RKM81763.1 prepilin-type N-terminal cleavage/methylation domain-containing protein [Alteromonas sp. BL110]
MAFPEGRNKKREYSGFKRTIGMSLIELLIVISITSILSVSTVPSFRTWLERNDFKHFASQLANSAKQARIYALTQKKPYYLIAKFENANCVIISDNENCTCSTNQHCALNDAAFWELPAKWNAKLTTLNAEDKTVVFNQHGTLNFGSATTFKLSSDHFAAKVTISPLGRVKLCSEQPITGITLC